MKRPMHWQRACLSMLLGGLLGSQAFAAQTPLDAHASDPQVMGWMQGFPPAADKQVTFNNYLHFPYTRWAFSHIRELLPTATVGRAGAATSPLPQALREDIDALQFQLADGTKMTWAQSLDANYTDGILVLHRGKVVYERYAGALQADRPHMAFSVTKSFIGTLAAMLVEEGVLDEQASVASYVPELADSGFGNASVRQVMDMTTAIRYSETYSDTTAEIWEYSRAGNLIPRPADYKGATSLYAFLQKVQPEGQHGDAFAYRTVNSDVLAWVVQRATGTSFADLLEQRIWGKLGAEQDSYIVVDQVGTQFAGGGMNASLRDMARFGEAMRNNGRFNGQQIVPEAVVADIRAGGDKAKFAGAGYATLPGWSYRNMWWVAGEEQGMFAARGIHGQTIYVDPKAEMVIARFASNPVAANGANDPVSLPAYAALAQHLNAR
ncbi:serine hydrolase domain-containing protein [Halopseudomonas maritima]|uniref:serine hydrolase domain-containing protein n=1 Tax=Halopseudomonas maritima TaxID=2918528 RepID=UPI0037BEEDB2